MRFGPTHHNDSESLMSSTMSISELQSPNTVRSPRLSISSTSKSNKSRLNKSRSTVSSTSSASSNSSKRSEIKPITSNKYYELLKKQEILGHLNRVKDDLSMAENELESTKNENTKLDGLCQLALEKTNTYKEKYEKMEQIFTDHLRHLISLELQEECLGLGHSGASSIKYANENREKKLREDINNILKEYTHKMESISLSEALGRVARNKVYLMERNYSIYRMEQAKIGAEMVNKIGESNVGDTEYASSLEAEIRRLKWEKDELKNKLHLAKNEIDLQQEELDMVKERLGETENQNLKVYRSSLIHSNALERFTEDIKGQVKERFGFVPASLDYYLNQHIPEDSRIPTIIPAAPIPSSIKRTCW